MALDEGIIAAQVVEGSFTRDLFLKYLRDDLVSDNISISLPSTDFGTMAWSYLLHHHILAQRVYLLWTMYEYTTMRI